MSTSKRTVLITGCSEGSLGAALAFAFHEAGHRVLATSRSIKKMASLKNTGIEVFELDVLSQDSIKAAVDKVSLLTNGTLDILVNNAGRGHYMPFMHLDLQKARELFELNVWSYLSVTQAFLPMLMRGASPKPGEHKTFIVNNTSISSVLKTPYHSAYGASKAAMAAFNDAQRVELEPFGIRVVDLKTGSTRSKFSENRSNEIDLPPNSPYDLIRDEVRNVITGAATEAYAEESSGWAKDVVSDLLKDEQNPPPQIWRGGKAGTIQISQKIEDFVPTRAGDKEFKKLGGLDKLENLLTGKAQENGT